MTARFTAAGGHRLEYVWRGRRSASIPPIVMLHEGLGSVSLWKDFPERLAKATRRRVLVYSRYGYGRSDALIEPRRPDYMHIEARETLPALLSTLGIERPVLFGHSDGASIALIHAARPSQAVSAIVALAPHVFVETYGLVSIAQARQAYLNDDLRERLARRHADVESAFWGWNDIWLSPAFVDWNIEGVLADIACPVLAIQGLDDEYGTLEQLDRLGRGVRNLRRVELAECRHSAHRDQPDAVLAATVEFLRRID